MRYLKNLSSTETFGDVKPWEFTDLASVPEECFTDKGKRDEWINNPETQFHVYSMFEGMQDNLRLHAESSKQDENPPAVLYGVAPDYDVPTTLADVEAAMRIMEGPKPNYFEQTLSGHGRLVWLFEEPVRFPSRRFALEFLKKIHTILPIDRLPGLDKAAFMAPERYYTNGCRWTKLSSLLVPANQLRGFLLRIAERFDWTSSEFGKVAVSMERIADECRKKYPKFREWVGDFTVGAQGPSFWIDGSTSPKSAIVKETGIYTFSGHAHKAFFPWAELVGAEFVDRTEDETLGKATKDIYYDGKCFFIPGPRNDILCNDPPVMRRHLATMRGLSDKKPKEGGNSMVDKALAYIEHHQRIAGASSCAFFPHGVFEYNHKLILNTHRIEAMKPAPDLSCEWGPAGKFPFLSSFLDGFLLPIEGEKRQLDYLLAHLQYFYKSCLNREPRSGHGLIIAGPVNVGKTFFSRGLVARMVGGCSEANAYLTQSDNFNSELFDHALWVVDDGSMTTNASLHRLFTESVKRSVANREHRVNEKFRKAVQTPWQGRIIITLNDDPVSIQNIPHTDGSILEKLILLRAGQRIVAFRSQPEMEKILKDEAPCFARWLLNWTPPAYCFQGADPRFGIASYCEPSLLRTSNLSSTVSTFAEILTKWLTNYFNEAGVGQTFWAGSATDLRLSMFAIPAYAEALRGYKPEIIPRMLLQLAEKKMFKMLVTETDNERHFRIECEDRFRTPPSAPVSVPQAVNSNFEKK